MLKKFLCLSVGVSLSFFLGGYDVSAQQEFEQMSLEELLFMELPEVTIASAKSEKVEDAPANVYVITGEEMRNRGYT